MQWLKIDSLPDSFSHINFDLSIDNPEHVLDSTVFILKDFHIDFGTHPLHGNVLVQGMHKPRINADIFANLDLAAVERLFPMNGLQLKGKTNFELKAHGVFDSENSRMPAFSLNLRLQDGYVKYDTLPQPISNIQFHLDAENKTGHFSETLFDFKKISADFGEDNPLRGYLRFSGYPDVNLDAELDATLNIEDIEKMYPVDGYWLKGKFEMDVTAKGLYSQTQKKFPLLDAKMKLMDGSVQFKQYPHPIKDIHFTAEAISQTGDIKDAQFHLRKLTYSLEDEPFEITGSISDLTNYKYNLTANGKVDLAKISQVYPMDDINLAGLIDARITTSGLLSDLETGNYSRSSSSGTVDLTGVEITGKKVINPIFVDQANFSFTPSKIMLTRLNGKMGRSRVNATGDIINYMNFATKKKDPIKIDLDVLCDTLDLNEWMPAQTVAGKPVAQTDTSKVKLTVIEVPKNIDFTFDSQIHFLSFDDLMISEMDGEITMKDGVLSLHEAGFNSLNAKFNVSGDYNTRDMAHPIFDFDIVIDELDINRAYKQIKLIRDLAPSAANTYGKLSVDYKLRGELTKDLQPKLETLAGGGTMRIAEAKINGMKMFEEISKSAKKNEINDPHLKDFQMETEIRDSKIIVKPFSLRVSGFDADIEGFNTMNGMVNYLVRVELIPLTKIKIPFHVTGTYDNPKVALGKGHTLPY